MAARDVIAFEVLGGTVATDSGFSPNVNGCCVRLKIEAMGRRDDRVDPIAAFASLTISVSDPGFSHVDLSPVTRTRTITGGVPLKDPFPKTWTSIGSGGTVPPKSYCSNGNRAFYTAAGGLRGASAPTHTTLGQIVSDGAVSWECMQASVNTAPYTGYVEAIDGSDVWVYVMIPEPIYAGSTINSVSIGAGCYSVGGQSNNAAASIASITNSSALQYEPCMSVYLSLPHVLATGSLTIEAQSDHVWGVPIGVGQQIAGAKFTAWDAARTTSSPTVSVTSPTLSALATASGSPGGCAVECYSATINTSGLPAGDSFVEAEFYPLLGTVWRTRYDAEGADWQAGKAYAYAGVLVRNGSNFYVCTTAGTSSVTGPTGTGTAISDGTCVWDYFGNDSTKQNSRNIPARWHFYNDPAAVYKTGHCFVDPSGTATGTNGVFATFADANAAKGTLSNCYSTIQLAGAALQTYNNTAGGGLTTHNDPGNGRIYLKAGTHSGFGASMQTLNIPSVWLHVIADPTATSGTVLVTAGANKACSKRMLMGDGLSFTATATSTANTYIDPVSDSNTTRAQPVTELAIRRFTINQFDGTGEFANRTGLTWYDNITVTGGFQANNANTRANNALVLGSYISGSFGLAFCPTNFIGSTIIGANVIRDPKASGALPPMFLKIVDSKILGVTGTSGGTLVNVHVTNGTLDYARLGVSFVGSLFKVASTVSDKCYQLSADGDTRAIANVNAAYLTCAGERANGPYNDSTSNLKTQWFEACCLSLTNNMVFDTSSHGANLPAGARCQNYWSVYRVGYSQNCNLSGAIGNVGFGPATLAGLRDGKNSKFNVIAPAAVKNQFINDTSATGATPSNTEGDYHPAPGAQCLNMALSQGRKYALDGVVRRTNGSGAVGAFEFQSAGGLLLRRRRRR
ncbi:hypothetical protein [Schlesneria sp. DSM 10557]|uniref:hypothetical protein n=1 Tax=Schlesneria sp. DSM 10557 TaxID=3044399 RepID=UPI0035A0C151